MYEITINEMKQLINHHYQTKTPLFVQGSFGIGKSSAVRQEAKNISKQKQKRFACWNESNNKTKTEIEQNPQDFFVLYDERLSQYAPEDLRGLPEFRESNECITWKAPRFIKLLQHPEADGILLFDEINLAPPSIQASAYQLIHDRSIVNKKLSDHVFIMGCGNRTKDKAHVFDMPLPLRDRMSEVELCFDSTEWFEWAEQQKFDPRILAYLHYKEGSLNKILPNQNEKSATPRGWERCNTLIKNHKDSKLVEQLVNASVGEVVGTEMIAFIKLQEKIDLQKVLKNPKKHLVPVLESDDISLKYSLVGALSEHYANKKEAHEQVVGCAEHFSTEFRILLFRFMKSQHPQHFAKTVIPSKAMAPHKKTIIKYAG